MQAFFDLSQTSYWYPLVWIFAAGIILNMMPKKTELVDGQPRERWYWLTAMVLVLPYILWAGYRTSIGDTSSYTRIYLMASSQLSDIPKLFSEDAQDPAFTALMILAKYFGMDYRQFFLLVSAFQMCCMAYTFRRYSHDLWTSMFLFVASTDFISWMMNGMRQFIAVCMIFAAFTLLVRRKFILYSLIVLLASTIHGSALLMLPFAYIMNGPVLNRKTLLMICGTVLIFPFIDRFMPAVSSLLENTQYDYVTGTDVWANDDGTNMIRVLIYSVPALVALVGYRYIRGSTDRVMGLCVNASVISMAVYLVSSVTSGIYIGRIPIYTSLFGYMALPWMLEQIFEEQTVRFIKLMMVLCYTFFYYYQMGITYGAL